MNRANGLSDKDVGLESDEQHAIRSRRESHYSPTRGKPDRHCGPTREWPQGYCSMFKKPHGCTAVGGFIAAKGSCDWWDGPPHRDTGGAVWRDDGGSIPDDVPLTDEERATLRSIPQRPDPLAVPSVLMPGLTRYATEPLPPPQITPNAAGKVLPSDYNPNAGPAIRDVANLGMGAMAPEAGIARGVASLAPRFAAPAERAALGSISDLAGIAGGGVGTGIAMPGSALAEGARPTMNPDEANQVAQLKKEIAAISVQRAKATNPNVVGPRAAAVQAQVYDAQIAQRNNQIDRVMGQVADRQNAFDRQQEDYARAGQPFSVREGDLVNRIRAGSLGASALTGLARGAKGLGMAGSILGGGVEGAAGVLFPSAVDITKPEDTEAYRSTQRNLFENPNYWERVVAPDAVYGAVLAGAGHGIGHALGAPFARRGVSPPPPPLAPLPPLAPPALPAPTQGGKVWPSDYRQIQMMKDVNGVWRERGTGQFIPKHLQPPEPPRPRIVGGQDATVGRASGGRVDPANINHRPTLAQREAGNYAKDTLSWNGIPLTIENAKGSTRRGVGKDGKPWSAKLAASYGYIRGTEGKDLDHVDIFLGPHKKAPHVYVVDQIDHDSKRFDEIKALASFANKAQALRAYEASFSDGHGKDRIGHVTEMTVDQFKRWLRDGDTRRPVKGSDHDLPRIDTTKDVRWLSELSKDGSVFYYDKSLPRRVINNGKPLDPVEPLLRHEIAEFAAMKKATVAFGRERGRQPTAGERGKIYQDAHDNHGTVAERAWIKEHGYNWAQHEAWARGELAHLEKRPQPNPPPKPDVKPYPHHSGELEFTGK